MTPQEVLDIDPCFNCQDDSVFKPLVLGLLNEIMQQGGTTMTPQEVLNANPCFACQDDSVFKPLVLGLLNQIVINGGGAGGSTNIFAGTVAPNGVQSATGPAIYFQYSLVTPTDPPSLWFKSTAGTSNSDWH